MGEYLKEGVYQVKPATIEELKASIDHDIEFITPEQSQNVENAVYARIGLCEV